MTDFKQIIQLRNKGKTQQEIADKLGVSRRSVIRYLKDGKIPHYSRETKSNRIDPMVNFYEDAKEKLQLNPKLPLNELFEYLCIKGYEGSERTLRRKTLSLRTSLKNKEIFFQREVHPGDVMEGDFTEFYIHIKGKKRKVYLWVTSLPFSNSYFASPYYHCTFEAFADGSVNSFNEFGGIAKKYRLDNMSPAVSKILSGKERVVTARYAQLQQHYGFEQDFCNPAKGNEKGNVEANNKFIKNKINARILLNNISFSSLESFKEFVWGICREHNQKESVKLKFVQEELIPLPETPFKCFRTQVVSINKYSLFSLEKTGHMYSVPSKYIGLSLEMRLYPGTLDVLFDGSIVCSHKRIYGPKGLVSIMPEHVVDGLLKKPGAMKDWKYRQVLFERPAWNDFYKRIIKNGGKDKDYLKCLKLINKYDRELVTVAMELSMEGGEDLSAGQLTKIINNDMDNVFNINPLKMDLNHYDDFLKGGESGSEFKSKS
ncbi:MAG: IS21 family transposase [Candidatus Brocadiales bacterium]|nr:IS21 family transposase [Candidatus Brocadiales bacterium]